MAFAAKPYRNPNVLPENAPPLLSDHDPIDGAFVETAFTKEQVEEAIAQEIKAGITDATCHFLDGKLTLARQVD